ncbi:MAG: glycoside hydrolase family 1 protein [Metamycoplasmataceae bacterium]
MKKFPKQFIFSTSTCSYQIEGGRLEGGRTHSNWDKFTIDKYYIPPAGSTEREIGSIVNAADYYNKYKLDSAIMKEIGVNGFVYNLDWARIFPNDSGIANEEGLTFYENAFKSLIENNIKPIPILYHWDTPLWLEERGGTSSREFLEAFRNLSRILFKRLGKYTDIWFVNDENSSYTVLGYLDDYFPPCKKDKSEFWKAVYYLSISGAIAKEEFNNAIKKSYIKKGSLLGIDHDWTPPVPYDKNDLDDLEACKTFNEYNLDLFLDPNMIGKFPACFWSAIKENSLEEIIKDSDLKLLEDNKLDLVGWNYYRPSIIAHPKRMKENIIWHNKSSTFITDQAIIVFPTGERYTDWNWLIKPEYLLVGSHELWNRYKKPLMILENGLGYFDEKIDGTVFDYYRIDFLNEHLRYVQKAIEEGVNFIGYSAWTYCDIFSPSGGYRKKYGLVGVDFDDPNFPRFPKASMYWYKNVIKNLSTFEIGKIDYDNFHNEAKSSMKNKKNLWNK